MDLNGLAKKLDRISNNCKKEIEKEMKRDTLLIERQAKELAPVDTGYLKAMIASDVKWSGDMCIGTVTSNASYGVFLEFGTGIYALGGDGRKTPWCYTVDGETFYWTVGQPPQPYMFPAWLYTKDAIFQSLSTFAERVFK